jgi:hypothetical protein
VVRTKCKPSLHLNLIKTSHLTSQLIKNKLFSVQSAVINNLKTLQPSLTDKQVTKHPAYYLLRYNEESGTIRSCTLVFTCNSGFLLKYIASTGREHVTSHHFTVDIED